MEVKLFKLLILLTMGVNGALYLGWLLTPPNPDRVGYWFLIYFIVFPVLGLLGLLALLLRKTLNLPAWLGGILLLYVLPLTLIANSYQLGFQWILERLPLGTFEILHFAAFIAACIGLYFVMKTSPVR